jgi:branched-chain amino acid transport system substrate-binding protein
MKQRSQEPIRVGVLFSQTGVTSVIENSQRQATLLATEEINQAGGIDGRPIELVVYDPQSRPARYGTLAEKLILEDRVRLIVGCYMSSSRKAVIPVVERWNALLMYPTLYEGFEYSRNVFYTGAAPNQNSVQLADFMLRRFGSRVFMVGSDYIYPYESNRIMCDLILERGGEKVAEVYVPLDAQAEEFTTIMRRIKDTQPGFVFSTVVGDSTALLHRAYAQAGLNPESMPIASLTTSEAEVQQMGADIAEGHITSAPYFQSLPDPINRTCVDNYRRRFGEDQVTNQCWEAAYFQMHMLADAMRRMGTDNVSDLLRVLPGSSYAAPQGTVRIDEHNHHTYLHPRIGRANAAGQFDILEQVERAVRPDPYLVSHSLQDWSARSRLTGRS